MTIKNSKNINTAEIDAGGNVTIGDGNTIINLKEAAQYKELQQQLNKLNERFHKKQAQIAKFPDEEDFKSELLEISEEQNDVQRKLETLKNEVLKLAEEFSRIPINTERLRLARQYFEEGAFDKARAILDVEAMSLELTALKNEQENLKHKIDENEQLLSDKANEFLILARLTAINFSLPDRFEKTKSYFEQSLLASRNVDNLFGYAYFLQHHNQVITAIPYYYEVLNIYQGLVKVNPQTYLPNVATTLNNLANLLKDKNDYPEAEKAYSKSLGIYRELAKVNPQTYMPDVAIALNNLAILLKDRNDFPEAEKAYREALDISKNLAKVNPQTYLPDVALTLNNLANLFSSRNDYSEAEKAYREALGIYEELVKVNPQTYMPYVAGTLSNLAVLLKGRNDFPKAEKAYSEALGIYKELAKVNPQRYLPNVALSLNNLGNLLNDSNDYPEAEKAHREALNIRRNLAIVNPQTYLPDVAMSVNNLGNLLKSKNDYLEAEKAYSEAYRIYKELAKVNPQTYLPYVALTAVNMSVFYFKNQPDREKSMTLVKESIKSSVPFLEILPACRNYLKTALQVAEAWGFDKDLFLGEIRNEINHKTK